MNKKYIALLASTITLLLPVVTLALNLDFNPPTPQPINIQGLIITVVTIFWWIFVGASVILLILAGLKFLTAQGEPEGVNQARQFVIWGFVGIAVAALAFSAAVIIRNTFGIG